MTEAKFNYFLIGCEVTENCRLWSDHGVNWPVTIFNEQLMLLKVQYFIFGQINSVCDIGWLFNVTWFLLIYSVYCYMISVNLLCITIFWVLVMLSTVVMISVFIIVNTPQNHYLCQIWPVVITDNFFYVMVVDKLMIFICYTFLFSIY